ncbi:Conserved_hypothetical protein [Hexamita inflata]|uniref:PPPDE domain-containing protein n=1 Tax=Hexamita inflata TaxID=28002 RepID=A0AA86NZ42_9EUKA|nr:Conserved hypothetical protein [Hexamita inflata]
MNEELPQYAMTWAVIPCVSHLVPAVGHLAITDSKGTQYDFGGPYFVNVSKRSTIFGPACRYYQFHLTDQQKELWDSTIIKYKNQYEQLNYNLFTNNCHHFVAAILNDLNVENKGTHGAVNLVGKYRFRMRKLRRFCC